MWTKRQVMTLMIDIDRWLECSSYSNSYKHRVFFNNNYSILTILV